MSDEKDVENGVDNDDDDENGYDKDNYNNMVVMVMMPTREYFSID